MIEPSPDAGRSDIARANRRFWVSLMKVGLRVRNNWTRIAWTCLFVAAGLGAYVYVSAPTPVPVAAVRTVTAAETLGATGKVQGERVTDLGLDVSGVVRQVYVKEGDRVRAGQLMLVLDKSELDARVQGASDAVRSAQAELARASRGPLASEVSRARAELAQARLVGSARVAQAQARLNELRAGARPQEVKEAQVELQRRKRVLARAETDLKRTKELVREGAVAQTSLDQAEADVDAAQAEVAVQQEKLSLLNAGPRADQVAEARAAVAEAVASRDTGARAAQEALNTLLSTPRPEDVTAARAKVSEAQAELRRATDVRLKTDLRAPFDGIVAGVPVEEGQSISPGQALVVLHEMVRPVIKVETGEENLRVLSVGQTATVSSDAYPGRTFSAALVDLGSSVDPSRGTIEVKLRPLAPVSWLRPDMTVDVNIITKRGARRMVVPTGAVTKVGGRSSVLVLRNGKAVPVPVTTGGAGPTGVAVSGDLRDGELVVRDASGVTPGSDVRPMGR